MILRRKPSILAAFLALASVLIFGPPLNVPHLTPRLRSSQQISLSGPHRFVNDGTVNEDATAIETRAQATFEPVAATFALATACLLDLLPLDSAFPEREVFRPFRRLPSRSDNDPIA